MDSTVRRMEDIADGRNVIDTYEKERKAYFDDQARIRREKWELGQQLKVEQAERKQARKTEREMDKQTERQENASYIAQTRGTIDQCRELAMQESDPTVRTAYLQVVRQMDRQDQKVSWFNESTAGCIFKNVPQGQ